MIPTRTSKPTEWLGFVSSDETEGVPGGVWSVEGEVQGTGRTWRRTFFTTKWPLADSVFGFP